MKRASWFVSVMLGVLGIGVSLEAFAQTAPPPDPPPPPPPFEQKLLVRPKVMWGMAVRGAQVYTGNGLRLYLLAGPIGTGADTPNIDEQALRARAVACEAGQGCGTQLGQADANAIYDAIEHMTWEELRLESRLAAVMRSGSATYVVTDSRSPLVAEVDSLLGIRGRLCTPLGGGWSQPQCPGGGGLPPRITWVVRVVQQGYTFGAPYPPFF